MPSALDVALDIKRAVPEGFLGLDRGALEPVRQRPGVASDDHASATAASGCFGYDRKPNPFGERDRLGGGGEFLAARRHRDAGRPCEAAGREFVAHRLDRVRCRADEDDASLVAQGREGLTFRQEAIAGVQAIAAGRRGGVNDQACVKVRIARSRRSNHNHAVRFARRHAVAIRGRCGEHRLDAEIAGGAHDPQRDLAAIGDQNAPQRHGAAPQTGSIRNSG